MEIYDDGKKPFITPLGVAKFPALVQPDTQFDKPHGEYKVDLILTTAESNVVEAKAKEASDKNCMPISEIITLIPEEY